MTCFYKERFAKIYFYNILSCGPCGDWYSVNGPLVDEFPDEGDINNGGRFFEKCRLFVFIIIIILYFPWAKRNQPCKSYKTKKIVS